jgi:hypothetical protein
MTPLNEIWLHICLVFFIGKPPQVFLFLKALHFLMTPQMTSLVISMAIIYLLTMSPLFSRPFPFRLQGSPFIAESFLEFPFEP